MKLTHRIVELYDGLFTVERYVPWNFFGIDLIKKENTQKEKKYITKWVFCCLFF